MTNETLETLKTRRSCRAFTDEQVPEDKLQAVLEAGLYAPTGAGTQGVAIVAAQDPELVAQLSRMNAAALAVQQGKDHVDVDPYYGAKTVLIALATPDSMTKVEDGALAAGNMLNAAASVGLGACYIHRGQQMFESAEGKALLATWGLPEDCRGVATIALGVPAKAPAAAPARKEGRVVRA